MQRTVRSDHRGLRRPDGAHWESDRTCRVSAREQTARGNKCKLIADASHGRPGPEVLRTAWPAFATNPATDESRVTAWQGTILGQGTSYAEYGPAGRLTAMTGLFETRPLDERKFRVGYALPIEAA